MKTPRTKTINSSNTPKFFNTPEEAINWLKESVARRLREHPELMAKAVEENIGRWGNHYY